MNIIDNEKWHFVSGSLDQMQKQSDRLRKAAKGLFIAPESPLLECQSWTEESLIAALSLLIDDNFELISWFVYECDYGRDPKHAGGSGDMRLIDSHDKLRWIIESNFCRN